jgi:hypothetical protein
MIDAYKPQHDETITGWISVNNQIKILFYNREPESDVLFPYASA